jgi:F-type H+-transporting ATPase subunit a
MTKNQFEITTIISQGHNTSPLDQFTIRNLISLDLPVFGDANLSLTNIGLYLTISTFIIIGLYLISTNYNKVVSNN